MKIKCKLFGVPEIDIDGEKVFFSYSKIDAFVYYILMNKTVSRSEIAGLLWPEDSEKVAKKNLRNALYHAKKSIHKDFILSPNNTILQLNEELDIYLDVLDFLNSPIDKLYLYEGEFLKGFYLKDSESYENWIRNQRDKFEEIYTSSFYEKISKDISLGIFDEVESNIQKLIDLDKYDEKNYRLLMEFYLKTGRNSKVIETYGTLNNILKRELKVEPDESTKKLYRDSMSKINLKGEDVKEDYKFYFGREVEIADINEFFSNFKSSEGINTLYIEGEVGVGKSFLLKRVFEDISHDYFLVKINCYQIEADRILKSVEKMVKEIEGEFEGINTSEIFSLIKEIKKNYYLVKEVDLQILELENKLLEFFDTLETPKKLVINFEDMHWMDFQSLKVLTHLILNTKNPAVFVFSGRDQDSYHIEDFISNLERYEKIKEVKLNNFSKEESFTFLKAALPEIKDREIFETLHNEAEGNPFFLSEYVKVLKSKKNLNKMTADMEKSIRGRIAYLSPEERELLELFSFFPRGFSLDTVKKLADSKEEDVVKLIDKLVKRRILEETTLDGENIFEFTHGKIREYLYSNQYKGKKRHYHKRIGDIIEENTSNTKRNLEVLKTLSYHFEEGKDDIKVLKYHIEILNYHLNFSHEMYPILDIYVEDIGDRDYILDVEIKKMFEDLQNNLEKVRSKNKSPEVDILELKFYYMKGRYLIREGRYKEGLEDIEFVIRKGRDFDNKDYVLNGYKQMIFYNIQRNNPEEMKNYVEKSLNLAVQCNYHKEIGMLLRLKGLYNIMVGNYEIAEKLLRESISSFEITEKLATEYSINIAAAYNYIGVLKFAKGEMLEAIDELKHAIDLTKDKKAYTSLAVFYVNLGKVYFTIDIKYAKKYFDLARKQYNQVESFWKMPVMDSYMALIELIKKDYTKSKLHLENAIKYSDTMEDPRALGTVCFAQFIISKSMDNKDIEDEFKEIITKDSNFYKYKALDNLDEFRDVYEISVLNEDKGFI